MKLRNSIGWYARSIVLLGGIIVGIGSLSVMAGSITDTSSTKPVDNDKGAQQLDAAKRVRTKKEKELQERLRQENDAKRRALEVRQKYRDMSLCLSGTDTAYSALEKSYGVFRNDREDAPMYLDYTGGGNAVGIRELACGRTEAALVRGALTVLERVALRKAFPATRLQPQAIDMGRLAIIIVVNGKNPLSKLTRTEVEAIYTIILSGDTIHIKSGAP